MTSRISDSSRDPMRFSNMTSKHLIENPDSVAVFRKLTMRLLFLRSHAFPPVLSGRTYFLSPGAVRGGHSGFLIPLVRHVLLLFACSSGLFIQFGFLIRLPKLSLRCCLGWGRLQNNTTRINATPTRGGGK